ncbi:MAG TPA: GNAT family N-acetyltransferase [Candidatus Limnocylindrales bacterium]|nr:GNAT family N-acetyltransferase [Candidatus Limnocylindrales bacterium]
MDTTIATPTLVLRTYRGPEDHPAMTRVAAAVRAFNGDAELGTVADMDNYYGHLEHADLPRDCALVELDGRVVAYGRASWEELANGDRQVGCILNLDPAMRGRGIEELLVGHALRRAAELIVQIGRDRTTRAIVYVTGRDPDQRRVVELRGLRQVRRGAQLIRPTFDDIPELPIPEPLRIRPIGPADRAMHRRIFEADTRAFADSYGQEAPSETRFDEFINQPTFDPTLWRVAFDGDVIAGQILSYMGEQAAPDGSRIGWTEAISVQPEYRRRGLARALLAESLRTVRDAGATSAGLGVDTQNPNQALTLYESLGFRIVSETFEYEWGPFGPGETPWLDEGSIR